MATVPPMMKTKIRIGMPSGRLRMPKAWSGLRIVLNPTLSQPSTL